LTGTQGELLKKISEGVVNAELEAEIKKVGFIHTSLTEVLYFTDGL